jgi:hypothetical protein
VRHRSCVVQTGFDNWKKPYADNELIDYFRKRSYRATVAHSQELNPTLLRFDGDFEVIALRVSKGRRVRVESSAGYGCGSASHRRPRGSRRQSKTR